MKTSAKGKSKVQTVLHEFKEGSLHSGSAKGPKVTDRKQAVAIALSEARSASRSAEATRPLSEARQAQKMK
jgi:hypothetical protein